MDGCIYHPRLYYVGNSLVPTKEQALQFCIMLQAGLPAEQAILYFTSTDNPAEINAMLLRWQRSAAVGAAQVQLLGKAWQDMTLEEQIQTGLKQQYAAQAYLCFSVNYITATDREKAKIDTAMKSLEAKVAGTSGKGDPLAEFFSDIKAGKFASLNPKLSLQ